MKNKCAALLLIVLLCLSACGRAAPPEETDSSAAQTTEAVTTTKQYPTPKPPETVNTNYVFTNTWAKTPAHFYAVNCDGDERRLPLSRVPLNNISKTAKIDLPQENKGYQLHSVFICGVTEQWLYVNCSYEKEGDYGYIGLGTVYRVSHDTLKAELIEEYEGRYYCKAWYNAASNSLLLMREKTGYIQLEALRLDTGERSVIFDDSDYFTTIWTYHWYVTNDGLIALEEVHDSEHPRSSKFVVVDKENSVSPVQYDGIKLTTRSWEKETEIDVPPNDKIKELLEWDSSEGNGAFGLRTMDDMVLVMLWGIYGRTDGYFEALYDPATGAVFSAE